MKNNQLQDERVTLAKRKIQSDGFQIIWLVLIISVLTQQYLYKATFIQYAVEFFILIIMSIYVLVANIGIGNDIFSNEKRSHSLILINSLVTGAVVTIVNTITNYINYSNRVQHSTALHLVLVAVITFVSCTVFAFIVLKLFYIVNNKRQRDITSKLNNDDLNE